MGFKARPGSVTRGRKDAGAEVREETLVNGATAAAMPLERKRMAGLWEREVGGLPPRSFANAVMASKVFFPSPPSLITSSSD